MEIDNEIIGFFLFIIVIGAIFELVILGIAFFGADQVDCNLLWCSFKSTRTSVNDTIILKVAKTCFYNGEEVDCDNNSLDFPVIPVDGNW